MAKFIDLSEQDRIQYIKDGFVLLLERLAKAPAELQNYIKVGDKPKLISPAIETTPEDATDEQKKAIEERNQLATANAKAENEKIEAAYAQKLESFKKVETLITGLKKKEGCLCGACIDINITNSVIPPELEPIIEIARKEAEARSY